MTLKTIFKILIIASLLNIMCQKTHGTMRAKNCDLNMKLAL